MSVFVHNQDIKTVHAEGGGVNKWQNSVHVVVECPLSVCGCHLRVLLLHLFSMSFVSAKALAKAQLMENPLMLHGPRFTVRLDSNPCLFETFETYFEVMNSFQNTGSPPLTGFSNNTVF